MTQSNNPRRSIGKQSGSGNRSRARHVRASGEASRAEKKGLAGAEPRATGLASLPPHHQPSRNGATPDNAPMVPIEGAAMGPRDGTRHPEASAFPLIVAAAGAAGLGFIATAGHLWSGALLFPHRLRALLAILITALLWTLCARIAPSLSKPQSKGRRFFGIALFLAGTICLLAALQTAKFAVAYLTGGFSLLLGLSVFLTAHLFALTRGRLDLYLVSVFGWSTILGALSIALLLGEWDPGSGIVAAGYGALCVAVALSSWHPASGKRLLTMYSSVVLFGCITLPAITIISGQPPRYLVTYLILLPAARHLRQLSSSALIPPPRNALALNLWYLALLTTVSVISSQSASPPLATSTDGPLTTQESASSTL